MKQTDILGQALPTLKAGSATILPPPLFAYKEHFPFITAAIRQAVDGEATKETLAAAIPHLSALMDYNTTGAAIALKWRREGHLWAFLLEYFSFIRATVEQLPYCTLPNLSGAGDDESYHFERYTAAEKMVADYARLSIPAVNRLNYVDFLILQREAVIHLFSSTEKGREMLEDAYCLSQTEPDRAALRARCGGVHFGE